MAEDDYKVEYHLTPNGWVRGTSWFFGKLQDEIKQRPNDTVRTCLYHETQSSMYGKPTIIWKEIWSNPDVDENTINALIEKYPRKK